MLEYDGISELKKASLKRLRDARELLESPTHDPSGGDADSRHLCAAAYLAGYSVECALKVVIIDRTNAKRGQRVTRWFDLLAVRKGRSPSLSGANSHNLASLLTVSGLDGQLDNQPAMEKSWGICRKWKPAWRYRAEAISRKRAEGIVQACEDIYNWLSTQW